MDFSERKKPSAKDQVRSVACAKVRRKARQRDEKSFTTANLCQNYRNRDTFSAKPEQKEGREQNGGNGPRKPAAHGSLIEEWKNNPPANTEAHRSHTCSGAGAPSGK